MQEKKTKDPTLYSNLYEFRRDWLWTEVKEDSDEGYPNIVNYFCPKGRTPVSGRVFQPPKPDFKIDICIKRCFEAIKTQMTTKNGQPRASMLKLKDYEITDWASLLEYLRSEWQEGNREKVLLTGKEYYMLFPKKK
jgi:hypothetical protein